MSVMKYVLGNRKIQDSLGKGGSPEFIAWPIDDEPAGLDPCGEGMPFA